MFLLLKLDGNAPYLSELKRKVQIKLKDNMKRMIEIMEKNNGKQKGHQDPKPENGKDQKGHQGEGKPRIPTKPGTSHALVK